MNAGPDGAVQGAADKVAEAKRADARAEFEAKKKEEMRKALEAAELKKRADMEAAKRDLEKKAADRKAADAAIQASDTDP